NIAAVNFHYRSKEQLYLACVRHAMDSCMQAVPLPAWPPETSPAVRLREFIQTMLRRLLENRGPAWHTQLMSREMLEPTDACAEWVRDYVRPMATILQGILAEMLPAGMPPAKLFQVAASVVGQC